MVDLQTASGGSSQLTLVRVCKTTAEWLTHIRELTSIAASDASMVKVFPGRWNGIRQKLEQLPSELTGLEERAGSANHPLCNELLQSISNSLLESKDLAERCIQESYGGKLQMQSSLDALAMKLSLHVQECELLAKSGILQDSSPPSRRSSGGASKEAVKWSVRDMLARLQIGKLEAKQKALESLVELMLEDDKNVLVVARQEGGVSTLVHLLDAGVTSLREKATASIHRLTQIESCEQLLVSEGALGPLVRLLEAGTPLAKEKAAAALMNLTSTPENARSVAGHGGVSALIEICQSGTPGAQAAAAGTLRNLASIPQIRETVADEGSIPVLIGLVTSGTPLAQEHACDCLKNLSCSDEYLRQEIIREGAIQALIMFYDSTSSPRGKEAAMGALSNLAASSANVDELLNAGFLSRLITALKSGLSTEQEEAASAVCHLSSSMELRKVLGETGCIPPLVKMLEGKTTAVQELASQAIFNLILVDCNRRAFCKEDGAIARFVGLLDPSQGVAKKFPISALLCLSGKKRCRKQMLAAGARGYLVKLADVETIGARKLLERLDRGKLWTLFGV